MIKECCDICEKEVTKYNCTRIWLKNNKGILFEMFGTTPAERKWEGVICDECLKKLRGKTTKEEKTIDGVKVGLTL